MTKTWCVGGGHYRNTNNISEYQKRTPKTKFLVKLSREKVVIVDEINLKSLLSK